MNQFVRNLYAFGPCCRFHHKILPYHFRTHLIELFIILFHRHPISACHKILKPYAIHGLRQGIHIMIVILCLLLNKVVRHRLDLAFLHELLHNGILGICRKRFRSPLLYGLLPGFPDFLLRLVSKSHLFHLRFCHSRVLGRALNAVDRNGKHDLLSRKVRILRITFRKRQI